MRLHTLFFSPTGTTATVVKRIASHFDEKKYYDLTLPKARQIDYHFDEEDVLLIGVPVYSGRIPRVIDQWLYQLKGKGQACILVAVYGNRAYEDALLELKERLLEQNFKPIAAGAFIGQHSYTDKVGHQRPDEKDLEWCDTFYNKIQLNKTTVVDVPGQKPYRPLKSADGIGPKVNERCLKCGLCVIKCPTGALSYGGGMKINASICIKCHACVQACPMFAISFDDQLNQTIEWLEEHAFLRREPELFV